MLANVRQKTIEPIIAGAVVPGTLIHPDFTQAQRTGTVAPLVRQGLG
ncbi:MAG: hypothetical protein ACRYHQ_09775 [Janthinobacterium lividum]